MEVSTRKENEHTMRTIYLPSIERRVTLGQYVQAVKLALAHPEQEFKCGLTCWWPCTGADIARQFMEGVHDRINQAIPAMERGIK